MSLFGYGDEVRAILELEDVEELEPLVPSESVLILGRSCRALFTGIFARREESHESITDGRGAILKSRESWLGIEGKRRLVRTDSDQ